MTCVKTGIFKSNRGQAVRLPREVAFPESVKDVEVTPVGNKRMIQPVGQAGMIRSMHRGFPVIS